MESMDSSPGRRSSSEAPLRQMQQWMYAAITHPDGVRAGTALNADDAHGANEGTRSIEDVILPSRRLSSEQRLSVYANAYYARLVECLSEEFRASAQLLGEETFGAFAVAYLQSYPSRSYTLNELGRDFPRFLRESRLSDDEDDEPPQFDGWCDFLVELAMLERLYSDVFSGPGCETTSTLRSEDIEAYTPEDILESTLIPVPCLRLVRLRYPTHEYITSSRAGKDAGIPEPQATHLAVTRREYIVRRAALEPLEFELLSRLVDGCSIAAALEDVAQVFNLDLEELAQSAMGWFERWTVAQYFQRIAGPDSAVRAG